MFVLFSWGILSFAPVSFAEDKTVPVVPPSEGGGARKDEGDYVIEKRTDGSTVKYKKKTSYDFEGANIDGLYNKPSGSYISNIKDVKAKSIIRIRENFDPEVVDSARSVK
jgi:hypothetical protein